MTDLAPFCRCSRLEYLRRADLDRSRCLDSYPCAGLCMHVRGMDPIDDLTIRSTVSSVSRIAECRASAEQTPAIMDLFI